MSEAGARGELSVVAMGGGTGLPVVLRAIKGLTPNVTAIVTVTDDGGSSGRLRGELGIPAPGDIRNCLVALADTEPLMERLFQHRFSRGSLAGHSFGNLFIGAMTELLGDFEGAVRAASRVLRVRGQVLPSTQSNVQLHAVLADGTEVRGETAIAKSGGRVRRVYLDPPGCKPVEAATEALLSADLLILGPGSLYTSVIPNLLVDGVAEAVCRSNATKVYVANIMTQPGETEGYSVADHLRGIIGHIGDGAVDWVLANTGEIGVERLSRYRLQGAEPVAIDTEDIRSLGVRLCARDLVNNDDMVRHEVGKLAQALSDLVAARLFAGPT